MEELDYSFDDDFDSEVQYSDEYSLMMMEYIKNLPDHLRSSAVFVNAARLRQQGLTPKAFMWMSDRGKMEALGLITNTDSNLDYEE